jgi:homoserine dehydrogenase
MRKIAILGMIAFKKHIHYRNIPHYGLGNITQKDLRYFHKVNQSIKMIACINRNEAYVMPTACPKNSLFAQTKDEFNAITIKAEHYDALSFVGKGAGRFPTASAIVDDLISISNKEVNYSFQNQGEMTFTSPLASYYLRVREPLQVDPAIIARRHESVIITTPIDITTLNLSNVLFYVRIRKEDLHV